MKPAAWMCGKCAARFTKDNRRLCCSNAHDGIIAAVNVPLFTRDDLVRAVKAGQDSVGGPECECDETPEQIVDEMLREGEG